MVLENLMGAGILAALAGMVFLAILLIVALYVYNSLAWYAIAKKLKSKVPWLAWIPIANGALVLQLGGFHWAWIFLVLIPILGWIALGALGIISLWRICEKRRYPGWLAIIPLLGFVPVLGALAGIATLVILGFLAWGKK